MNTLIYADAHLYKTKDGKVWAKTIYGYDFWKRYLEEFEHIYVMARMDKASQDEVENFLESSGPNVEFVPMPMIKGSEEGIKYILKYSYIIKNIRNTIKNMDCAIVRLPSVIGFWVAKEIRRVKIPFAVEVVANPIAAMNYRTGVKKLVTLFMVYELKRICSEANGVSYVTENILQKDFPSYARKKGENARYFETYASSIDLYDDYYGVPRDYTNHKGTFKLVHIANSISGDAKGHTTVINVIRRLQGLNVDAKVFFIGDGPSKDAFEQESMSCGVGKQVEFVGIIKNKEDIRDMLLNADMYIFPSKYEGLPRSVLEAMAVGLPCIASDVGGIPELLDSNWLFKPEDDIGMAKLIVYLINNPKLLNQMSFDNINKARLYSHSVLQERRNVFYRKLRILVINNKKM